MADRSAELLEQVRRALDRGEALQITGSGSKAFMGRQVSGRALSTLRHSSVVEYEPSELVISARAGTTLAELDKRLAREGQWLGCESPMRGNATIGGALACNQSGPARPSLGSIRDHALGLRLVNGRGEDLRFGGRVMKNVAGYDVTRLQAGAMGTLGLIIEVSLRVFPRPECESTVVLETGASEAVRKMSRESHKGAPLSGACWADGRLYLRFSGCEPAVRDRRRALGGERLDDADAFWASIREQQHAFFGGDEPLWRLSVKPAAGHDSKEQWLIDWGGAQRWLRGDRDPEHMAALAERMGGQATLFRGGDRRSEVFHPRTRAQKKIHLALKRAFDPECIFNSGRLYSWM